MELLAHYTVIAMKRQLYILPSKNIIHGDTTKKSSIVGDKGILNFVVNSRDILSHQSAHNV